MKAKADKERELVAAKLAASEMQRSAASARSQSAVAGMPTIPFQHSSTQNVSASGALSQTVAVLQLWLPRLPCTCRTCQQ